MVHGGGFRSWTAGPDFPNWKNVVENGLLLQDRFRSARVRRAQLHPGESSA
jgi:hypothetical protein